MDPITTAILAALSAFATRRAGEALEGAYSVLKSAILRKFGNTSELLEAVNAVEEDPTDPALRQWLKDEIDAVGAANQSSIRNAAESVLSEVRGMRGGKQMINIAREGGVIVNGNIYKGNIRVDRGDFVGGNKNVDQRRTIYTGEHAYIPQTPLGWVLSIPAAICIGAGLLIFFFSFADAFSSSSGQSDEVFSDMGLAFKLLIVGFIVGTIATVVDKSLASRRKR